MLRNRQTLVMVAVLLVAIVGGLALAITDSTGGPTASFSGVVPGALGNQNPRLGAVAFKPFAASGTSRLCHSQQSLEGAYTVQNNEWGSGADECISAQGTGFTVANSSIENSTSGAPGGYPSIYMGCHWGSCTSNSGLPVPVANLAPGKVTTSWSTTQPGTGAYDVAYDIWFNQTPTTTGQPNGTELMVWLNHNGPVQPFGSQVGTATVGGRSYNVWFGKQAWNTVSYTMTTPATSVSNLDIGQLTADAVSRGYIGKSWYLIDVEAGFELWQGGAGLATNSFSVNVSGAAGHLPAVAAPTGTAQAATQAAAAPPATGAVTSCKVGYAVTNSWGTGFQAQVTVANTGKATVNGWALGWTFPGGQHISQLWNGVQQQSGQRVTVTNASYNSAIAPGSVATFGFIGENTGGNPPGFRLNGTACQTA